MATRKTRSLTQRQKQVLRAIYDHMTTKGAVPSYREVLEAIGLGSSSTNAIVVHLNGLARKGYLTLPDPDRPVQNRCIRLRGVRMVPVIDDDEDGARLRAALEHEEGDPCP